MKSGVRYKSLRSTLIFSTIILYVIHNYRNNVSWTHVKVIYSGGGKVINQTTNALFAFSQHIQTRNENSKKSVQTTVANSTNTSNINAELITNSTVTASQKLVNLTIHTAEQLSSNTKTSTNATAKSTAVNFGPVKTEFGAQFFNVTNAEKVELFKDLEPTIPHIIHQTWRTKMVPEIFKSWMEELVRLHPDWDYYFWTDDDVKCLLKQQYPEEHLHNFMGYSKGIFRGDALRFV